MTEGRGEIITQPQSEWASLVELIHGGAELDDRAWLESILCVARRFFAFSMEVSCTVVEHNADCTKAECPIMVAGSALYDLTKWDDAGLSLLGRDFFRAFYYPARSVTTHTEIERGLGVPPKSEFHDYRDQIGVGDVLGMLAHPEPGVILSIFALHNAPIIIRPREREALTRVTLHLETAYRLRRRGEEVVRAEIDMTGKVLYRSADAPEAEALSAHVIGIAQAKSKSKTTTTTTTTTSNGNGVLAFWPALVSGRFSLVERKVQGHQRYLLIENALSSQPFRALTNVERDVVSQAARGLSTKMIAYSLGVSPSSVSASLASAAGKVGASSRMDLVRLAAMFVRDPRARFDTTFAITDAERDVLELLNRGLSNEEIATLRSRSVRTIANQVASLLRKTNSTSRRDLVVRAASGGASAALDAFDDDDNTKMEAS